MASRRNTPLEWGEKLIGQSGAMQEVRKGIAAISKTDLPILITGEVGTEKELVAKVIHENSTRRKNPFVAINLAAIPSSLLAAELVGVVRRR